MYIKSLLFIVLLSYQPLVLLGGSLQTLPEISFDKESTPNGKGWKSSGVAGKVVYWLYVDPDKKSYNKTLANAIKAKNYDEKFFQTVAVINMQSTMIPNFLLNSALKDKQKEYPKVDYIKDFDKRLVKEWGLADDEYVMCLFDHTGSLIYYKYGELPKNEINKLLTILDSAISKAKASSESKMILKQKTSK